METPAFIASAMADCQSVPLDMLMFYDARLSTSMNSLFDKTTKWPLKGYYPFYAWSKLVDCGTQVACTVREGRGKKCEDATGIVFKDGKLTSPKGTFHTTAAKGADGSGALLIARYSNDDNTSDTATVTVKLDGASLKKARCHLTDAVRVYTEVPLMPNADGTACILMQPNSFALVEW